MKISKETLLREAQKTGFRPEILEKVWHLMFLLDEIFSHALLKECLVLKGGTALNLFLFNLPRLSVDIDLNFIGSHKKEEMLLQKSEIQHTLEAIFRANNYHIRRVPQKHAGGKWQLQYSSALGTTGNLEVDVNFMFRILLWQVEKRESKLVGSRQTKKIPILDSHELSAGKLTALFARHASRDLFDAHHLLTEIKLDEEKLRFAFILHGAMSSKDWRDVSLDFISFHEHEIKRELLPLLRKEHIELGKNWNYWCHDLVQTCRKKLRNFFPLRNNEIHFLNLLYEEAVIDASLLTDDQILKEKIEQHPLLGWKVMLAKQF